MLCYYNLQRIERYNQLITKKFETPLLEYKDKYQVELDVKRSFYYLDELKDKPQKELQMVLDYVFYHTQLSYIQGFHDICATLVLVSENAKYIAYSLALHQFARFLKEDGVMAAQEMCTHAYSLIYVYDQPLFKYLSIVPETFFISWIFTAFQHDITCLETKLVILDRIVLESTDFLVYLTAAFIINQRSKIIAFNEQQILSECSELRHIGYLPLEQLNPIVTLALKLHQMYKMENVKKWTDADKKRLIKTNRLSYIMAILVVLLAILIMQIQL